MTRPPGRRRAPGGRWITSPSAGIAQARAVGVELTSVERRRSATLARFSTGSTLGVRMLTSVTRPALYRRHPPGVSWDGRGRSMAWTRPSRGRRRRAVTREPRPGRSGPTSSGHPIRPTRRSPRHLEDGGAALDRPVDPDIHAAVCDRNAPVRIAICRTGSFPTLRTRGCVRLSHVPATPPGRRTGHRTIYGTGGSRCWCTC